MAEKQAPARKRQLIDKASRNMFIAVAVASVVVGFSLVGSIFLFQKMVFNAKVIGEKNNTVSILRDNNNTIAELENRVKALSANTALREVMNGEDGDALRVIPDALPATNNPAALGASFNNRLLNVPGLTIESIVISPVAADATPPTGDTTGTTADTSAVATINEIPVSFSVKGDRSAIEKVISNLEKSIRTIDIISYTLSYDTSGSGSLTLSVEAKAFYSSEIKPALIKKEVKP
ncbi:hypothetical protein FWF48_00540 [Candidatus Saccharibacteria bacterium]|nr:hypothetical protein [Candidatus Saccharibacteria bacterium]